MSYSRLHALAGAALLLGTVSAAEAQDPPGGQIRELRCRGKSGIDLRIHQGSSPRQPELVTMVLRYERMDPAQPLPGTCTWNPDGFPDVPPEPGVVYFDLPRDAQIHVSSEARDTTVDAGAHFPDVASLTQYLSHPDRFWVFYVDDASNFAISYTSWPPPGAAPDQAGALDGGSTVSDAAKVGRTADLRCRGGSALGFSRSAAGTNLVLMTLTYPVSPNVPGEAGHGLAPGSCAWDDRAGLAPEGGTIAFVTAANAQLAQARSGSAVDRSATAADRWPDAQTIPVYLTDPSRYWTFTVAATDPDSARHHAAWKPALGAIAGERSADPGATSMSFDPHDVRAVVVTPGVAGVEIQFEGPAATPLVQVSTTPPFREPSTGRWIFPPDRVTLRVVRAPTVGPNGYVATNSVPLQRAAEYHYIINAQRQVTTGPTLGRRRPVGSDQQAIGSFRTLRTMVTVRIGTVRIINDSDDGGSGELAFTFTINGSYRFEAGTGLAEVSPGALLDLSDGDTYTFARDIMDANAGDHLRIHAAGFENDGLFSGGYFTGAYWNATPGGSVGGDWNQARAEFYLDQYPGRSFDFPLRMRTGPGSTLQFEVEGHVTVARE